MSSGDDNSVCFNAICHIRIVRPNFIAVAAAQEGIPFQNAPCSVWPGHEIKNTLVLPALSQSIPQLLRVQLKIFSVIQCVSGHHFAQKGDQVDLLFHSWTPQRTGAERRCNGLRSGLHLRGGSTGGRHLASKSASVILSARLCSTKSPADKSR